MNRILFVTACILFAQGNGQLDESCFGQSAQAYGSYVGEDFSSQSELRLVDFDRSMRLSSVTGCFGEEDGELYSLQLKTRSTDDPTQEYRMPLIGEIMGECSTVSIAEGDIAKYVSIYWTKKSKTISGLKIRSEKKKINTLGDISSGQYKRFTFEDENILVGFYGTRLGWQINSLGIIHLDPYCVIEKGGGATNGGATDEETDLKNAVRLFERICIGVLATSLLIAVVIIIIQCKLRKNARPNATLPTPGFRNTAKVASTNGDNQIDQRDNHHAPQLNIAGCDESKTLSKIANSAD